MSDPGGTLPRAQRRCTFSYQSLKGGLNSIDQICSASYGHYIYFTSVGLAQLYC